MSWGNRRANLYWEAHLKPGHIPPDHKMESFIRSKYESRRWALDGPPPSDPSILENAAVSGPAPEPSPAVDAQPPTSQPRTALPPSNSLSDRRPASPATRSSFTTRQPQPHQLISTQHARAQSAVKPIPAPSSAQQPQQAAASAVAQPKAPENDLFSLDFHAPSPSPSANGSGTEVPRKDKKQDILSLFSTQTQPQQAQAPFGAFASAPQAQSPWGQAGGGFGQQQQPVAPSVAGNQAGGTWGVGFGWNAPSTMSAPPAQGNIWGAPASASQPTAGQQQPQSLLNADYVWGAAGPTAVDLSKTPATGAATTQKKDDVFGDIWGDFK